MQSLRDNPECADEEYARITDLQDAGLSPYLSFDPDADIAAPYINTGAAPKMAILREQGINGQVEMGAAFDRGGFEAVDVHMTDLLSGRCSLDDFHGLCLSRVTVKRFTDSASMSAHDSSVIQATPTDNNEAPAMSQQKRSDIISNSPSPIMNLFRTGLLHGAGYNTRRLARRPLIAIANSFHLD